MKSRRILSFVLWALALLSAAQVWSQAPYSATGANPTTAQVTPATQGRVMRILTPVAGQTLSGDFADVRYELIAPNPTDENNFVLQLDDRDPVNTSDNEYTFTGLQPGRHTVTVQEVDANGTPMQGSLASVNFAVLVPGQNAQQPTNSNAPQRNNPSPRGPAAPDISTESAQPERAPQPAGLNGSQQALPAASSALPLLSIVGFGALIGGALSAMRSKRH